MEKTLRDTMVVHDVVNGFRLVVSIRVQGLISNDVVLQESLEIFLSILAKEEAINFWAQLLEGEIRGCENSSAHMVRGVCNDGQKTGLCKAKFQGTKLAREELDDAGNAGWWDEEAVNAMDNAVRSKLDIVSNFPPILQ